MKNSNQLKDSVKKFAKNRNVGPGVVLRNYMLERILERISLSDYKYNFVLKGGLLISSLVGLDNRTTMDLDTTIKGALLTKEETASMIEKILKISVEDGVTFNLLGISEIREEADYPGYRLSIEAVLDKTKEILKIDITTGDIITPREIEYSYKLLFE